MDCLYLKPHQTIIYLPDKLCNVRMSCKYYRNCEKKARVCFLALHSHKALVLFFKHGLIAGHGKKTAHGRSEFLEYIDKMPMGYILYCVPSLHLHLLFRGSCRCLDRLQPLPLPITQLSTHFYIAYTSAPTLHLSHHPIILYMYTVGILTSSPVSGSVHA